MLEVSSFTDWYPKHFLDVAEMTTALVLFRWSLAFGGLNLLRLISDG